MPVSHNDIHSLYSAIKKDNLEVFQRLIEKEPSFIHYKNKYGKSILVYALESNAEQIVNLILSQHPNLLFETNNFKMNVFEQIIYKNQSKSLELFFKLVSPEQIRQCFTTTANLPIHIQAIKKLNQQNWEYFYQHCSTLIPNSDFSFVSQDGLNTAHYVALANKEFVLPILQKCDSSLYYQLDNDSGSTPLLISAKYSNLNIIKYFEKFSDITQTTYLQSNLSHVSCFNEDYDSFKYINQLNIDHVSTNLHDVSPLLIAINEKSNDKANMLFPFYQSIDISEEILDAAKNFTSLESFWKTNLPLFQEKNIVSLKQDKNKICNLFCSLFYYCDKETLSLLIRSPLWDLLNNLKNDPLLSHQIFLSIIANRKHMSSKFNATIEKIQFLHANETEEIYSPIIDNNDISFKCNLFEEDKQQKGFCLVAALGALPNGQIKEIIQNSNLLNLLNQYDLLLLFSIGLKRKSNFIIEETIKQIKNHFPTIEEETNYDLSIQHNLSFYETNNKYDYYYRKFLQSFEHIPTNLFEKISHTLIYEHKSISDLNEILKLYDFSSLYKKLIVTSTIEKLFQSKEVPQDWFQMFIQKPTLLFFIFKKLLMEHPDSIQNNELFNFVIQHNDFSHTAKNWKFIFSLAQSNNLEKHDLIKNILPTIKINNQNDFKEFQQNLLNYKIDDHSWRLILNKVYHTKFFQPILNQYLLSCSLNSEDINIITLKKSIEKIQTQHTNSQLWMSNIINNKSHHDSVILLFEELFLKKNSTKELINISIESSNFSYLEHLIKQHSISCQHIDLSSFWKNNAMQEIFELNFIQKQYTPLTEYLLFIKNHNKEFKKEQFNDLINQFLYWYAQSNVDQKTKLIVSFSLFSSLEENISMVDDVILVKVCKILLNNEELKTTKISNLGFGHFFDKNNLNNVISIIFNHKKDDFLTLLEKRIDKSNAFLSDENKKIMGYYSLKNDLNHKPSKMGKGYKI